MRKSIILSLLLTGLLFISQHTIAQYYQFSQYNFSAMRVNPGSITLDNYARVNTIYRSQESVSNIALNSFFLSAKYPIQNREGRWAAVGVSFEGDNVGLDGLFEKDALGITYAFVLPAGENQQLGFGIQGHYHSRKINTGNLVTGSQFVQGQGFDQGLSPGEDLSQFNRNFISLSAGFSWQATNEDDQRIAYAGLAAVDINRPDESFVTNGANLPVSWVLDGGVLAATNKEWQIYPEFLYSYSGNTHDLNIGLVSYYALGQLDRRLRDQSLAIHTKYLLQEGIMLGLQWHMENLSIGTSYDIAMNNHQAQQGTFEIGLALRQMIKENNRSKRRPPVRRRRTPKPVMEDSTVIALDTLSVDTVEQVAVENTIDVIPPAPVTTRLTYQFPFASSEPEKQNEAIVEDILSVLNNDRLVKIKIVGHTDDVGPAAYNQKLSIERAQSIYNILISLGVNPDRIAYDGKGESEPIRDNTSEAGRAQNRRVEIIFTYDQ